MKSIIFALAFFASFTLHAQEVAPFNGLELDSTYKIIAISTQTSKPDSITTSYNFCVEDQAAMNRIKNKWVLKKRHANLSFENYSITMYVVKGKELISIPLFIFPKQKIANYKNEWYDFNMEEFDKMVATHPLTYRSQTFEFPIYSEYIFFEDSIQTDPKYLFLLKPTANKFQGHFYVVAAKQNPADDGIFTQRDIEKEIKREFPDEKPEVVYIVNDSFNVENKDRVRLTVNCSKSFFEKYQKNHIVASTWKPYYFSTRVIFRE